MTELNTVLEGEYKGAKIKKEDCLKIIYDDANCKTTIDIKKSNVDSYDIIDETNKRAFSLWKTLLLGTTFLNGLVLFNEKLRTVKKEAYLVSVNWKDGKKSLICIDKEWKEARIRGMF